MTKDDIAALLARVREHPGFPELEAVLRQQRPDWDDVAIAAAACRLLAIVEDDERQALREMNPGLHRVQ